MQEVSNPTHLRRYLALLLVVVAIASTQLVAWSYFRYIYLTPSHSGVGPASGGSKTGTTNSSSGGPSYLEVNALINYGNGSTEWRNGTKVPLGSNAYDLTHSILNITCRPVNCSTPHFIWSINALAQNATYYWSVWTYCGSDQKWVWSQVGVDDIKLTNEQTLAWYFTIQSNSGSEPPVEGAKTEPSCSA